MVDTVQIQEGQSPVWMHAGLGECGGGTETKTRWPACFATLAVSAAA